MKLMLKPLVFALGAILAAGAYADGGQGHKNGASAEIDDEQGSYGNEVLNQGTDNEATLYNGVEGASGNIGINITAGDNNQQANAAALAAGDAFFVFGAAARADIDVEQRGKHNKVDNYSVPNTANLHDAVNNTTGNVGVNISAGNFNQQKNDMAAAVSETAYVASASVGAEQKLAGNTTNNYATLDYGSVNVNLNMTANGSYSGGGSGSYAGQSDQIGDLYPDTYSDGQHPNGGGSVGHIDLDSDAQGAQDLNGDGGALAFNEDGTTVFTEAGTTTLGGTVSGSIPVVAGFNTPVVNDARLYNALNNVSGNVGVNIAAGVGNQQSNSLAIAAGCTACAPSNGGGGE